MNTQDTFSQWKTLGDEFSHRPDNPWAKSRFVATHDAKWENDDPNTGVLESGKLICEMRDGALGNVSLIAAAPELLAALNLALATIERLAPSHRGFDSTRGTKDVICAAIAKAEGKT